MEGSGRGGRSGKGEARDDGVDGGAEGGTEAHVLSTEKTIKSHRAVPKVLSECVCHGSLPMF